MNVARQALWALMALAMLHLSGTLAWAALRPVEPAPGPMMPAAGGPVEDLAIQFHRVGASRFLPVFGALLQSLDPSTTVHVVVGDEADREMFLAAHAGWFPNGGGPNVQFASADRVITSWMRDRLAVLGPSAPGAPATLLVPESPMTGPEARAHDWIVPWVVGDHLGDRARVRATLYRFDGGDFIADEDRAYVATPFIERNPGRDPARVLAEVEEDLGLPVLRLGTDGHDVPDHHIGMFLTPLGDGRVAVGDPDLALSVLDEAGLAPDDIIVVDGKPLVLDRDEARLDRFRRVAEELEAAGLEVVPIPILPTAERYVFISYNNVLTEHRIDGVLHVYLPVYGVEALDDAATAAWEAEGAVVHPIDVQSVFRLGGSVRCLVAPIHRGTVSTTS